MSKASNGCSMHHSENKDGPPGGQKMFFLTHSDPLAWKNMPTSNQEKKKKKIISELSKRRSDIAIIHFPLPLLRLPNIFLYSAAPKKIRGGKAYTGIRSHILTSWWYDS